MTLTEQVFAQAALLAGELDGRQTNLLRLLCGASASSLAARLRELSAGTVTPVKTGNIYRAERVEK